MTRSLLCGKVNPTCTKKGLKVESLGKSAVFAAGEYSFFSTLSRTDRSAVVLIVQLATGSPSPKYFTLSYLNELLLIHNCIHTCLS